MQEFGLPAFSAALIKTANILHVEPGHLPPDDEITKLRFRTWYDGYTDFDELCAELEWGGPFPKKRKPYRFVKIVTIGDAVKEFMVREALAREE